ncbi:MAG: hypothetical protein ACRDON_02015, partial [Gaiellaceae bacterium]
VGGGATVMEATQESAPAGADQKARGAPILRVQGPAAEVARELRTKDFDAHVAEGSVVVNDADAADVQIALRDRPPGAVAVFIE